MPTHGTDKPLPPLIRGAHFRGESIIRLVLDLHSFLSGKHRSYEL